MQQCSEYFSFALKQPRVLFLVYFVLSLIKSKVINQNSFGGELYLFFSLVLFLKGFRDVLRVSQLT